MAVDPFAVLNALLRAEAARQNHHAGDPEPAHPTEPATAHTTSSTRSAEPEGRRD
ncbi:hypothetical protein [Streptomyces sp. NPDC126499]|uniref:hypothetical protein n=1 Tax=Streptomyces sp. NPDC126499 TaxID=3155314 RepID=UPI0033280457